MKRQPIHLITLVASLLLCSTVGWAQGFGNLIFGQVVPSGCQGKHYQLQGTTDLSDGMAASCSHVPPDPADSGTASSEASLDVQEVAKATAKNETTVEATGSNTQTATLHPPIGFKGSTVQFSYTDSWGISLSGMLVGDGGQSEVCWIIGQLGFHECQQLTANGNHVGQVHHQFVLTKDPKLGFQLTISKSAGVVLGTFGKGHSASGAAVTPATINLTLPKGWTCKYDSGTKCP